MVKPAGKDLLNEKNFLNFVRNGQKYNTPNGIRSTAAVNGSQQWAATTHTVSDILQGNLSQINPEDQLLVLNKGLTDSLKLFAETPENPQGFSTFTNTVPNFSNRTAGGGGGGAGAGFGATVEESWVRRLPHKHENGALIWMPEGKASNEMHLPTSGNLQEDIAQHIQYPELPPNQQHPWYMDREGGGIGGEVNNLPSGPAEADTILREDKNAPGATGAFGYLSPLEEQFYCLPEYTNIYTAQGPTQIKDIVEGTEVYSYDTREHKMRLNKVSRKKHMGRKKILQIKTLNYSIECTEEHKLLILTRTGTRKTRKSINYEWVKAKELNKGDVVLAFADSLRKDMSSEYPTGDIAFMSGLMLADGVVNRACKKNTEDGYGGGSKFFRVCIPEKRQRKKIIGVLKDLGWELRGNRKNCCLYYSTSEIQKWIYEFIVETSPNRMLPNWVWNAPTEIQKKFIEGYMYGDGSYSIHKDATQLTSEVSCCSEKLVEELRILCHYVGYRTSNKRTQIIKSGYKPGIAHGFVFYENRKTKQQIPSSYSRFGLKIDPSVVGKTIREITDTNRTEEVWDIEVENDHNFFAEGVLVHNCSMAWPYRGTRQKWLDAGLPEMADIADNLRQSEHYKGRRVLVFSVDTKRAVVCTPAEWGPNPYYSNGAVVRDSILGFNAGLSPDVMYALGITRGDKIILGWMDDNTPLGPYGGGGVSPNSLVGKFVALALEQVGKTYIVNHPPYSQINSDDPPSFDCSGLIMWAALKVGYVPPEEWIGRDWSYSVDQLNMIKKAGTDMSREEALKTTGAILCRLPKGSKSGHVSISIGDGRIVHAASPAYGVTIGSPGNYDLYGMLPGMQAQGVIADALSSLGGLRPT